MYEKSRKSPKRTHRGVGLREIISNQQTNKAYNVRSHTVEYISSFKSKLTGESLDIIVINSFSLFSESYFKIFSFPGLFSMAGLCLPEVCVERLRSETASPATQPDPLSLPGAQGHPQSPGAQLEEKPQRAGQRDPQPRESQHVRLLQPFRRRPGHCFQPGLAQLEAPQPVLVQGRHRQLLGQDCHPLQEPPHP